MASTLVADDSMSCATPWASDAMPCVAPFPSLPGQHASYMMSAPMQAADDLDLDQLSEILRQCHLHEEEVCGPSVAAAPANAMPAANDDASNVGPWAEKLLQQLQCCASVEEGRALCTEALVAFHQHQGSASCSSGACPYSGRLEKLQGANKVIVRALRSVSQRMSTMQERARQAEETNAHLAEQLRLCQEQLKASERAKANLQSHLQLMNSSLSECAMHTHQAGPRH